MTTADAQPELLTIDAFIRHWAADRPQKPAMVGERRINFAELEASTARVASALQAAGLQKGDRIAWLGKNAEDDQPQTPDW
ncbi:MAG TPA: AMP-binding protein [Promineifilum sp.]|nr:AMP-binding protein [Promineifilum sp.]